MRIKMRKTLLFIFGLLLWFPAVPIFASDTSRLTLGPGVLTFPEIAQKLSVDGRKVELEAGLKYRAAYVYLKDRSWDDVTKLLAAGLEVQFRRKEENRWVMEWDSNILQREDRWHRKLASLFRKKIQDELREVAPYLNLPYPALLQSLEETKAQAMEAAQQFDGFVSRYPNETEARAQPAYRQLLERRNALWQQTERISALLDFGAFFAFNLFRENNNDSFFLQLVKKGRIENSRWIFGAPYGYSGISNESVSRGTGWIDMPARTSLRYEITLYLRELIMDVRVFWQRPGLMEITGAQQQIPMVDEVQGIYRISLRESRPDESSFLDELTHTEYLFRLLGDEAMQWLQEGNKASEKAAEGELLKKTFEPRLPTAASLSQLIEVWSKAQLAEAIMQLWPLRESLWGFEGTPVPVTGRVALNSIVLGNDAFAREINRLNEYLSRLDPSQAAEQINQLKERLKELQEKRAEYLQQYQNRMPWTFRLNDRVLMVMNRAAFLERSYDYALQAYRNLEQKTTLPAPGAALILPFDAMITYCTEVSGSRMNWARYLYGDYRGLPIGDLGRVRKLLHLINYLPNRSRTWQQLKQNKRVEISLARVSPQDFPRWVDAITTRIPGAEGVYTNYLRYLLASLDWSAANNQNSPEWLRYCTIWLRLEPEQEPSSSAVKTYRLEIECRLGPLSKFGFRAPSNDETNGPIYPSLNAELVPLIRDGITFGNASVGNLKIEE